MKKICRIVFFVLCYSTTYAQLYDKHWISGNGSYFSGADDTLNGNIRCDFGNDSAFNITIDTLLTANFDRFNITMSDSSGDSILFYTNGVTFWNKHNQVMQNGDSLGWGWYIKDYDPTVLQDGLVVSKSGVCLPTANANQYSFFYTFTDSLGEVLMPRKVLYALVDVSANALLIKDSVIIEDTLSNSIIATKRADDSWWILIPSAGSSCVHVISIDSDLTITQRRICDSSFILPPFLPLMTSVFTEDGSKVVITASDNTYSKMEVLNFDRCDGTLSLHQKFDLPELPDSSWAIWNIVVSPNSRFVYAMCSAVILQFDLWAADIKSSMTIVAHATGNALPFPTGLYQAQLALDGKIYVNSGSMNYAYSVIENPDLEGLACNVVQDIITPDQKQLRGFPYYPNYRLNQDCHSSGINEVKENRGASVYPNPFTDKLTIVPNMPYTIYDMLGREVYCSESKASLSQLPFGAYTLKTIYGSTRIIKE
jgi:hypothetical protein